MSCRFDLCLITIACHLQPLFDSKLCFRSQMLEGRPSFVTEQVSDYVVGMIKDLHSLSALAKSPGPGHEDVTVLFPFAP